MTYPSDAVRLAQQLYDTWFEGDDDHAHDEYPDVVVDVDGRYLDVESVTYDVGANVIRIVTASCDSPIR